MIKQPREGMRVRMLGMMPFAPVPRGTLGTIGLVAGFRGKSIYCDPSRLMVFVHWDNGESVGAFRKELEQVRPGE